MKYSDQQRIEKMRETNREAPALCEGRKHHSRENF